MCATTLDTDLQKPVCPLTYAGVRRRARVFVGVPVFFVKKSATYLPPNHIFVVQSGNFDVATLYYVYGWTRSSVG